MYMILSRSNARDHEIIDYAETLDDARLKVRERIEELGSYADRLHLEAFKIVQLIETAGGEAG